MGPKGEVQKIDTPTTWRSSKPVDCSGAVATDLLPMPQIEPMS